MREYGDPGESLWHDFFMAAISGGHDVVKAKAFADMAYAAHCERWPRDRKVVTLEQHTEACANERLTGANAVIRALGDAAMSAYNDLKYRARGGSRPRVDAAEVLHSFAAAAGTLLAPVNGRMVVGSRLEWRPPPEPDDSDSYVFNERATKMVERLLIMAKRALHDEKLFEEEAWKPAIREASEELWRAVNRSNAR